MELKPSRSRIHPLTILAAVLLAGVILGLAYLLLQLVGTTPSTPEVSPTDSITVIPAPTQTEVIVLPTSLGLPTPTSAVLLPPGVIGIGAYVKVGGTEGIGLRMRAEPGTSTEVQFVAMDEEVFLVVGGPVEMDDYIWWQLEAPYDQNRIGWSAESFLKLVELSTPSP